MLKGITAATTAELINKVDTITDESEAVKDGFPNDHRNTLTIVDDFPGFQSFLQRGKVFFELIPDHSSYDGVNQLEESAWIDQGGYDHIGAAVNGLEAI